MPLPHQSFRVGEVVQPLTIAQLAQAIFAIEVERCSADSLLGEDAVAGSEIQRDRRRAVAHDLNRYPRTQTIIREFGGLGKDGGLNQLPRAIVGLS